MISDGGLPFVENVEIRNFNQVSPSTFVNNAIFLDTFDSNSEYGIVVGDYVTITGSAIPANNVTDSQITSIQVFESGSYLVLSDTLTTVTGSPAIASFKSQYNTLPNGCGCSMSPTQVDVAQHVNLKTLFPSLPEYDFYIKDTLSTARDFLTEQIYFPAGFYRSDRAGRSSVGATIPPLVLEELIELTDQNVKMADNNKIKRQITKDFFNNVTYKFNRDTITDRFLAGTINFSQRSLNRINTGTKSLKIESDGFRGDAATRNFIAGQARRFTDRYQFAAESIEVQTDYKTGMPIEVTDIVLFGNSNLQLPDINQGSRDFAPRLMEVVNKKLDIRGQVSLSLLDTGFGLDGRFSTISPNSFIGAGSSTTSIVLTASFGTGEFQVERLKWQNFIGEEIRIRNEDFTFDEVTTLVQFDPGSINRIVVSPAISLAPPEGYLVDLPEYPDTENSEDRRKMKTIHGFFDPQVIIVSAPNDTSFVVSVSDIDKFLVDAYVIIHNDDFTDSSTLGSNDEDLQVLSVDTGTNTVTLTGSMGFTPSSGYRVNLIGFKDGGLPYRLI